MKVVIVGGVAGGATAAARIRRLDERAEITVFERTGYISYANCGLPYYIGGVIKDENALTLQTPESFMRRFRVDMRVRHEVTSVNVESKTVTVKNLADGKVFDEKYDYLLLSPGAKPVKPRIPGIDGENIFTLRTVEDTFRLKEFLVGKKPKSVAVVGGGFIGIETAENLIESGVKVTLVEAAEQLMAPFDGEMAAFIHAEVKRHGVNLVLGDGVNEFSSTDGGVSVKLKSGASICADAVVLAIGVAPDTALAEKAGLALGARGSIIVDERMRTSVPDIYAVGDAVAVKSFVTGESSIIPLAGPANKQARIAADNICGGDSVYTGGQGSSVIKLFDATAAVTGINERTAVSLGIAADKVYLYPMSHAGYYPGGSLLNMKVIFEKETYRLLGAQIVGYEGVDKRIDVLATAIRAGLKAYELTELDLAYAPPYSSAKDPVNMAGFMIENIKNGIVKQAYIEDIDALPRDGSVTLLDTRTPFEFQRSHPDGFINIPVDSLRARLGELDASKKAFVLCESGLRSYIACRTLAANGFDAYNIAGGYRLYSVVKRDGAASKTAAPCGMNLPR